MRVATISKKSPFLLLVAAALFAAAPFATSTVRAQDDFEDEFDDSEGSEDAASSDGEAGGESADTETTTESDDAEGAAPAPESEEAAAQLRAQRFLSQNTWGGAVGGIRVVDAGSGPRGTFRLQLGTQFFSASDFLNEGDTNTQVGGVLSLSWTPLDFLEVFGTISSYANSNDTESPALFQVLGDTTVGAKGFYTLPRQPWLTVGGDLTLNLLNTVGDIGLVGKSTSLGIRGNVTGDFRRLARPLPIVARFNLQYFIDNSSQLTNKIERQRYDALDPADRDPDYGDETRNLLSRVERFALGINRLDRLSFSLGVEAPLKAAENFYISPMLEWRLGVPINRQGYKCLFVPSAPGSETPVAGDDGCLDIQGVSSFPQTLTIGARVLPPVRGLSAFAAVDIGLTGVSTAVRELAATAPYNVMLGVGYAYDTRPQVERFETIREVQVEVVRQAPLPPKGRVRGVVVERGSGTAIAGAVVSFPARAVTALHAAEDGTFTTYEFDPGEVQLSVGHPEYNTGTCAATIPAPAAPATPAPAGESAPAREVATVEVRCELEPLPRLGNVRVNISGDSGAAVGGASVSITGPMSRQANTDAAGSFSLEGLTPGSYTARVEAAGFFLKTATFDVRPRETTNASITLVTKPSRATVTVSRREIVIRRQINFATDSDVIEASSTALLTEIADVMLRNPQITRVEIQGHTDNVGSADHNLDLSQRRADSVRRWLVEQGGVESSRLESKGYGSTRPLVPNITPANRARNRRSQFIIQEQTGS
jgi:outer membrane protein OmpA-like peptidoglycan-associated protein